LASQSAAIRIDTKLEEIRLQLNDLVDLGSSNKERTDWRDLEAEGVDVVSDGLHAIGEALRVHHDRAIRRPTYGKDIKEFKIDIVCIEMVPTTEV